MFIKPDNMKPSKKIIEHLKKFEKLRLSAYMPMPNDRWTIGYGNTFYEDGQPVRQFDKISEERAEELFDNILASFSEKVGKMVTSKISINQFDSLVSFAYNVGVEALRTSTLLRQVNKNPDDYYEITKQFMRWNKQNGRTVQGLVRRRISEANIYCNGF